MAVVQLRNPTEGRAYYDRKKAAGKTPMEAMRALKRRLSDIVYRQMIPDARAQRQRAREDNGGRLWLQRGRLTPQHRLFGEVTSRTRHPRPYASKPVHSSAAPGTLHRRRHRSRVKRTLLDGGEDRRTLSRPGMAPS